ncbi:hypothetical protein [Siminovitchia terrae]|uniref:hypothetical protein n=1 Tax=Siminovitchia terrae TaxID=1914933 RepID=UPI0028B25478|nr:hypothetical protein [Siminovitchia terrae]
MFITIPMVPFGTIFLIIYVLYDLNEPPHLKHSFLKWGFPNQSTKSFQQDRRVTPIFCGKPQEFILPTTLGNSLSLDKLGRN